LALLLERGPQNAAILVENVCGEMKVRITSSDHLAVSAATNPSLCRD
jgi:hypothetical protein